MRPSLSLKTLFRSPIRTLLTFILLGVVTFALFSQIAEYAITTREFNNAAGQYCGVGSAEIEPPEESDPAYPWNLTLSDTATHLYQPLTADQIDTIFTLPYVTSIDKRYMTAGISDTYYRLDELYFYNFTARFVIEGTLINVDYEEYVNRVKIDDITLLAGNPPLVAGQKRITFSAIPDKRKSGGAGYADAQRANWIISDYIYDTEYIQNLTIGDRYVFILRFEPLVYAYELGDYLTDPWCSSVWPVAGAPDDYLETQEYAPLRKLIEITNADIHTFDMVYTDDMSSILRFADGSMTILDGRALTPEDSASGSNICVVSREFAEANELEVGDTMTMKLGTKLFGQYKNLGAVAGTPERYALPEETATLEIVGIYADIDGLPKQARQPHWCYSASTIFVPTSLLPADEKTLSEHMFAPGEFSFKVENAWDIPAFLEETAPQIEEMGLRLIFNDDGWPEIADGFKAAKQISLIKIAVLSAAVAAATGFVVYLFISRKKKEYAVMRALGTTKKVAARSLLLPLTAISVVAVLAGSGAAWIYTVKTVVRNNTLSMMQEYAVSTSVPAVAALGCILGEILLTLFIAIMMLRRIGALSPLALLQNNANNKTRGKIKTIRKKPVGTDTKPPSAAVPSVPLISMPAQAAAPMDTIAVSNESSRTGRKSNSSSFVLRYIWKHMRRSAGKSALTILMAALLFAAIGQFALIKRAYTDLCTNTVIKANFVGGLELGVVPKILTEADVTDPYYEVSSIVDMNAMRTQLAVTNNIARYIGEEVDITYTDGYDASVMDQMSDKIIVGKTLMEMYGLEPGDKVQLSSVRLLEKLQSFHIDSYRQEHPEDELNDEEIAALLSDEIMEHFNETAHKFTIAGIVSTMSGKYEDMAFTPGGYASTLYGTLAKLDVAEFTLADNFKADEFRAYAEHMAGIGMSGRLSFIMDTSELEHLLNSLKLLETLYPIAVASAFLIGGFLCCLVILQSSKEAAIMRILGTTKRKTRVILALEQMLLSITGLLIGACGLLAYKGAVLSLISGQLVLFAALYFAVILVSAAICSALATRRNVLELLQTKE